jgi:hypothetical protein
MTIISAYQDAGTYRGAAAICGTTPNWVCPYSGLTGFP